jgi:hypothetical protein
MIRIPELVEGLPFAAGRRKAALRQAQGYGDWGVDFHLIPFIGLLHHLLAPLTQSATFVHPAESPEIRQTRELARSMLCV